MIDATEIFRYWAVQARLEQKAISCPQVCLLSKENYAKRISRRALCRRIIEATSLRVILTVSQKGQNMPDTLLEATVIITTTGLCLSSLLSPRPHLQFPLGINLLFTLFQMLCCCDHNAESQCSTLNALAPRLPTLITPIPCLIYNFIKGLGS